MTESDNEKRSVELSIAIPFYNEEQNARKTVEDMVSAVQRHHIDYELILVNNGSRDRTGEILEELCSDNPRLKSIHLIANAGYGGGIITGLHYCTGKYLGYTWGDNQIRAEDVVGVYKLLKGNGLDWAKGRRIQRFYGLQRKIISKIYNILFKLIFRAPTEDVNGVPKIFTRECYANMDISSTNWFIDAEIMLKSIHGMYRFGELPLIFYPREGGSSNVNVLTVVEFIINMIQHKWERKYETNKNSSGGKITYDIYKIYSHLGFLQGLYTIIRMMLVPFAKIEKLVPKEGKILDLGCGNGLFSHFMYLTSGKRSIIGVDLDKGRIKSAQQTLTDGQRMEFYYRDVNDVDLSDIQIMTLIDLLHHMPYPEQEKLLKTIYRNLSRGGVIVVKDLKKDPLWKYRLHYVHDTISYQGSRLYFRSSEDMISMLEGVGFFVEKYDIDNWNIYPHVVYRCEKR